MEKTKKKTLKRTQPAMVSLIWGEDGRPTGDVTVEAFADDAGWRYGATIKKAELEAMGGIFNIRQDEYADAARRKLEAEGHVIVDGIWGASQSMES